MFNIEPHKHYFSVEASGKLTHEDYAKHLIPAIEKAIEKNKTLSLMIKLTDFHGWEPRAAWDDLKMAVKHHQSLEKVAIVGDEKWKFVAKFFSFIIHKEMKFFPETEIKQAEAWLAEN